MNSPIADPATSHTRRRWLTFGLASFLKLIVVVGLVFAWWSDRNRLTDYMRRVDDRLALLRAAMMDPSESFTDCGLWDQFAAGTSVGLDGIPQRSGLLQGADGRPIFSPALALLPLTPVKAHDSKFYDEPIGEKLYELFHREKTWLAANCQDNRHWQEFLDSEFGKWCAEEVRTSVVVTRGAIELPARSAAPQITLQAPLYLPPLCKLLAQGDAQARRAAAHLLALLGVRAKDAAPALAEATNDPDEVVRYGAAAALQIMGPEAQDVVPRLRELMNDPGAHDGATIAGTVACIDAQADVVPRLLELVANGNPLVRQHAVAQLMALGPAKASPAVPTLQQALSDEQEGVRLTAAHALIALADYHDAQAALAEAVKTEQTIWLRHHLARLAVRLEANRSGP